MQNYRLKLKIILVKFLNIVMFVVLVSSFGFGAFLIGFRLGEQKGQTDKFDKFSYGLVFRDIATPSPSPTLSPTVVPSTTPKIETGKSNTQSWSGPELWNLVNKRRNEFGVNELSNKSELCTIASIRLNELLELGKLDGHEGFSNMPEKRPDLKWIYDKYTLSEFLVSGAQSAQEAVSLWENTLGHKKLLTGGEFVWGCIYAQGGFGVAITAY